MRDIELVKKFALDYNFPGLVLKKNKEGNIVKKMESGKNSWINAMTWSMLKSPYNNNFKDVINACKKYDIIK